MYSNCIRGMRIAFYSTAPFLIVHLTHDFEANEHTFIVQELILAVHLKFKTT